MKISQKHLQRIIKEEVRKVVEEIDTEDEELEAEPEAEFEQEEEESGDYEDALRQIQKCEDRVEFLTQRLDRCLNKKKERQDWSSLWEE